MNETDLARLRAVAETLAGSHHVCDEDTWYSCPLSEEGCANDSVPKDQCNCGRDQRVVAILAALRTARREGMEESVRIIIDPKNLTLGNCIHTIRAKIEHEKG